MDKGGFIQEIYKKGCIKIKDGKVFIDLNIIIRTTLCSLSSLFFGGLIGIAIKDIYNFKILRKSYKLETNFLDIKLRKFYNFGALIGLFIGLLYGYNNKPLIYLL